MVDNYIVILMNENICRLKCITSERIGSVEQKSADKCINEYSYEANVTPAVINRLTDCFL